MSVFDPFERAAAHAVSYAPLSWVMGRASDLRLPRPVMGGLVRAYTAAFGIPHEELDREVDGYGCMNEFFSRGMATSRAIPGSDAGQLVSPVDGVLQDMGHLSGKDVFVVKKQEIDIGGLCADDYGEVAERFRNGTYALIYLSPRHYHRVHVPIDAELQGYRYIPGRLFPVNELGMKHVPRMFLRNERVVFFFETAHGSFYLVMVGASFVGRMTLAHDDFVTNESLRKVPFDKTHEEPIHVAAGELLGSFNLGSSVVMIAESKAVLQGLAPRSEVTVGQAMGRFQDQG